MPSGTDLGSLMIRQAMPRAAARNRGYMKVTDGNRDSVNVFFVPNTAIILTGFSLVAQGNSAALGVTSVVITPSGSNYSGFFRVTGTPTVGGKYKLLAVSGTGTLGSPATVETNQPATILTYDAVFGWSPSAKSSSVQNLEVKGDTVFGIIGSDSLATFKGSGILVDNTATVGTLVIPTAGSATINGTTTFGGRVDANSFCKLGAATVIGTGLNMGTLAAPRGTDGSVTIVMKGNKLVCTIATALSTQIEIQPDPDIRNASGGTIIPYVVKFGDLSSTVYYSPNGEVALGVAAGQSGKSFAVFYI